MAETFFRSEPEKSEKIGSKRVRNRKFFGIPWNCAWNSQPRLYLCCQMRGEDSLQSFRTAECCPHPFWCFVLWWKCCHPQHLCFCGGADNTSSILSPFGAACCGGGTANISALAHFVLHAVLVVLPTPAVVVTLLTPMPSLFLGLGAVVGAMPSPMPPPLLALHTVCCLFWCCTLW